MQSVLEEFYNLQGKSERIKNTPIPYSYTMYIKKFIFIYIVTLPFGFVTIILSSVGLANSVTVNGVNPIGLGETVHNLAIVNVEGIKWKLDGDDNVDEVIIILYNPEIATFQGAKVYSPTPKIENRGFPL